MFAIVDHATGEAWVDASPRMDRWAAADLLREVCTARFGSVDTAVAAGLARAKRRMRSFEDATVLLENPLRRRNDRTCRT